MAGLSPSGRALHRRAALIRFPRLGTCQQVKNKEGTKSEALTGLTSVGYFREEYNLGVVRSIDEGKMIADQHAPSERDKVLHST